MAPSNDSLRRTALNPHTCKLDSQAIPGVNLPRNLMARRLKSRKLRDKSKQSAATFESAYAASCPIKKIREVIQGGHSEESTHASSSGDLHEQILEQVYWGHSLPSIHQAFYHAPPSSSTSLDSEEGRDADAALCFMSGEEGILCLGLFGMIADGGDAILNFVPWWDAETHDRAVIAKEIWVLAYTGFAFRPKELIDL